MLALAFYSCVISNCTMAGTFCEGQCCLGNVAETLI